MSIQEQINQQPIYSRCDMISRWVDDCTMKDLEYRLPDIINEIFGISNRVGWNLMNIEYSSNPQEYEIILRFLNPTGAIFRMCYKLLSDPYIKYKFHLSLLPLIVRQSIENGTASTFYMEKLVVDPRTRYPMHLALNPLELYMFHFMYHVVNPLLNIKLYQDSKMHSSVYLRLAEEYLCTFLPCNGSTVQPELTNHYISQSPHRPLPQNPVRTSQLFREDVQVKMLKQSPAANALQMTSHAAIWRSELVVQLCRDLWLSMPGTNSMMQLWSEDQLPSYEHLYAVRLLVKHWHYFANSRIDDSSPMDELKKVINQSSQHYIYQFIRQTMQHWPLDSSFKQILEIWLSYIQPWRYVDFDARYNRPKGESSPVDTRWFIFIAENLVLYSEIFHQLIDRFKMMDLSSPKNAYMLFRLTKVFSQPNLPQLLRQVEENSQLDGRIHSKWVRSNLLDFQEPDFNYKSIFQYDSTIEVFMRAIKEAEHQAVLRVQEEVWQEERKGVWEWLWRPPAEAASADHKNLPILLSASFNNLARLLQVPTDSFDSSAMATPVSGPISTNEVSPLQLRTNIPELKFEGDPDLQLIRSDECTLFVRMLYHLCCWINSNYKEQLVRSYMREDVVGGVVRQVLQGPQVIYFYDKSLPGLSARVSASLPPRLSLRWLANLHLIIYFSIFILILKFALETSVIAICAVVLLFCVSILTIRSFLGFSPMIPVISVHNISENKQYF